jgi:glycine/D-amino acid oxidase-like deaminating enzyme
MRLVVAGSGIVGSACAYVASSLGAQVTLVDAARAGQATAAGAGIICPWTSGIGDPDGYALACAAARAYPALVAELAALGERDVSYRQVGALVTAGRADELERARADLQARRGQNPEMGDVQVITAPQARALFPPLRAGLAAVHIPGAARVDGRKVTAALIRAAQRNGATVRAGDAVLACRAGRPAGVLIGNDLIGADAVVAATGAWTPAFVEPAGVAVRVTPQRGQIVHLSLGTAGTGDWPVVLPAGSGHYLLAFDGSRVVIGATREPDAGFGYRVTAAGLSEVLAQALAVAPGLGPATYLETRVGFRPAGPDARPLLGPVPGVPGLIIATGLGAEGLTMGPYAGGIAARAALGLDPGTDLTPFSPLR